MNWLTGNSLPWFHQTQQRSETAQLPPFQIPDFIKHAAQQHLAAQQVAQLKQIRADQINSAGFPLVPPPTTIPSIMKSEPKLPKSRLINQEAVDSDTPNGKKRRGNYASYTPQQRIEIGAFSIGRFPYG